MSLTLLAPELRVPGEAHRTVTRTGIVIGGAWQTKMPALGADAELLQAALLDKRTTRPRPWYMRALGAFVEFC